MPTQYTVERFVALVEAGANVEAIEEFYALSATVQENDQPPRVGRQALVEHERKSLASVRTLRSTCVRPMFIAGDFVVLRWVFEYESTRGSRTRLEELAYQRWLDQRIVEEKFFYDPSQFKSATD